MSGYREEQQTILVKWTASTPLQGICTNQLSAKSKSNEWTTTRHTIEAMDRPWTNIAQYQTTLAAIEAGLTTCQRQNRAASRWAASHSVTEDEISCRMSSANPCKGFALQGIKKVRSQMGLKYYHMQTSRSTCCPETKGKRNNLTFLPPCAALSTRIGKKCIHDVSHPETVIWETIKPLLQLK